MKKRLFLTVIPTVLALSACNVKAPVNKEKENDEASDIFLEDDLAHEEIFGDCGAIEYDLGQPEGLQPRRSFLDRNLDDVDPMETPKIGVQYQPLTNDKYAIRYVAAISSLNVTATWTRDICDANGNRPRDDGYSSIQFPVTKAYSALSESGADGNDAPALPSSVGSQYHYFVVFTLRNIPKNKANSYLFGYLTITSLDGTSSVSSQARISKVSGGNSFKFDPTSDDYHGYFIQGNIGGSAAPIKLNGEPSEGNYAQKENLPLSADDTFGVFKYQQPLGENHAGEHFQFFGYEQLKTGAKFFSRVTEKDYFKVPGTGDYDLYLNTSHEIHIVTPYAGRTSAKLYFKPGDSWTGYIESHQGYCGYGLYIYNDNENRSDWRTLSDEGHPGIYSCDPINIYDWPNCILVRLEPGRSPNWDYRWSQTRNLYTNAEEGNIYYVNNDASTDAGVKADGHWDFYIPE